MLIEFLVIIQILAFVMLFVSFGNGGTMSWALAIVLFAIVAITFYNVEVTKVLTTSINETLVNASFTRTSLGYTIYNQQSKDIPMAYLNMGLSGFCVIFLLLEIFKKET